MGTLVFIAIKERKVLFSRNGYVVVKEMKGINKSRDEPMIINIILSLVGLIIE